MHGNRDFLLGKRFCAETGAQLLADGTVVDLYGRRVLLMHGDTLCIDDPAYQRLRRIVRNPLVQADPAQPEPAPAAAAGGEECAPAARLTSTPWTRRRRTSWT